MLNTVLVFADGFNWTSILARNRDIYDSVVRTAFLAFATADTQIVVNLCLAFFVEMDCVFRTVHITAAGNATTA